MIMMRKNLVFIICVIFLAGNTIVAQDYIGSTKCKMCHNKPATGQQYKIWSEGPHAKAMESLSSDKAKAYAKEHNIADPTKEASCIKCHSTAGSIDESKNLGVKMDEGVSCESCHGPGSKYKMTSIMKNLEKAKANGLIMPDAQVCEQCHNKENPFHKPFNFEEYKAKIAHPIPDKG